MKFSVNFNTIIEAKSTTQALDRAASLAGQLEYNEYATLSGVNVNEHWDPPQGSALSGIPQTKLPTSVDSPDSLEASTQPDDAEE